MQGVLHTCRGVSCRLAPVQTGACVDKRSGLDVTSGDREVQGDAPTSWVMVGLSKASLTRPLALCSTNFSQSVVTMPAES